MTVVYGNPIIERENESSRFAGQINSYREVNIDPETGFPILSSRQGREIKMYCGHLYQYKLYDNNRLVFAQYNFNDYGMYQKEIPECIIFDTKTAKQSLSFYKSGTLRYYQNEDRVNDTYTEETYSNFGYQTERTWVEDGLKYHAHYVAGVVIMLDIIDKLSHLKYTIKWDKNSRELVYAGTTSTGLNDYNGGIMYLPGVYKSGKSGYKFMIQDKDVTELVCQMTEDHTDIQESEEEMIRFALSGKEGDNKSFSLIFPSFVREQIAIFEQQNGVKCQN